MIIHIWMHWFWITTLVFKGFLLSLSRHVLASSSVVVEAGLPDASIIGNEEDYGLLNEELLKYASHEEGAKERVRRTVEDEDVVDETTAVAVPQSNESMSMEGSDVYHGAIGSDSEDTYNGGSSDGFQYPLKKYAKYGKYNKLKLKPKTSEEVVEVGVAVNATTETTTTTTTSTSTTTSTVRNNETSTVAETMTVSTPVNTTEVTNQTIAEEGGVNQTVSESTTRGTVEVELTSVVVNVTEVQTPEEVLHREVNLTVESKLDESVIHTTVEPFIFNNRVAAATSSESRERLSQPNLDAGSITGITLGIVVLSGFIGAISFVLYRRRYLNKPQALNDKCSNLDSSGYIDDTSLRENSEEMYSLDNDSFLNSLEAMTIQNYWTENVKHTKL